MQGFICHGVANGSAWAEIEILNFDSKFLDMMADAVAGTYLEKMGKNNGL